MPPLSIVNWASDGTGGWFVRIRDENNVNGATVVADLHLDADKAAEFALLRTQLKATETDAAAPLARAVTTTHADAGASPSIPAGVTPYAIRDFVEFYEAHVTECIERIECNIAGHAPYSVLEDARNGIEVPAKFQRKRTLVAFDQFIQENGTS